MEDALKFYADRLNYFPERLGDASPILIDEGRKALAALQPTPAIAGDVVEEMVNRFLSWKLPEDFNPDGGIKYNRTRFHVSPNMERPFGTNLFTATQAEAMVRHMIKGIASLTEQKPSDGWRDIASAPKDELILIGIREYPNWACAGKYFLGEIWEDERRPHCTLYHYNGTVLVPIFYGNQWQPLLASPGQSEGE